MSRQLVVSVTAKDCDWQFIRGTGNGGSNRNKTSTAVRCTHRASGASGFAQEHREQPQNRRAAFRRMAESSRFRVWLLEQVGLPEPPAAHAFELDENDLLIEVRQNGAWVPASSYAVWSSGLGRD